MPEDSGILLQILRRVLTRLSALMLGNVKPKNAALLCVWLSGKQAMTFLNLFSQPRKMLL